MAPMGLKPTSLVDSMDTKGQRLSNDKYIPWASNISRGGHELRARKTEKTLHLVAATVMTSSPARGSALGAKYSTPTLVPTSHVRGHHIGCISEGQRPKGETKGATRARRHEAYL